MKKILLIIGLFLSLGAFAQLDKIVPPRPTPPKLVNDFTNILTSAQVQALEAKLVAYDDSTSNQVAVVIIPTLGDYSPEEVGLEIIRTWGVGNKNTNNGIVILVAKNDRKVRIEVGYGLEGAIPDITAKSIIDNEITPNFKEGNFYRGLDEAADAIAMAAAGEYKAPQNYGSQKKKDGLKTWMIVAIVIFIIISSVVGGTGGGTYVSRGGFGGWSGGRGSSGWSGGGGWWGGGGFGGFGGGSGGGGGASGSW